MTTYNLSATPLAKDTNTLKGLVPFIEVPFVEGFVPFNIAMAK